MPEERNEEEDNEEERGKGEGWLKLFIVQYHQWLEMSRTSPTCEKVTLPLTKGETINYANDSWRVVLISLSPAGGRVVWWWRFPTHSVPVSEYSFLHTVLPHPVRMAK